MRMPNEEREDLYRKMRETCSEYGPNALAGAVVIGMYDEVHISDLSYIKCPTVGVHTLGNVGYGVARFFELI